MEKSSIFSLLYLPFQLIGCFFKILFSIRYLIPLFIPYLIGIAAFILANKYGYEYRKPFLDYFLNEGTWYYTTLSYFLIPIVILISSILAIVAVLVFSETFIEFFIEKAMPRYGFKGNGAAFTIKYFIISNFKAVLNNLKYLLVVIFLTILTLICGFFPVLLIVPPIITAFLAGFNLFNLSLALLEINFSDRWRFMKSHLIEVIAVGATLLLFLLIPLGGIFFLPAAYLLALERMSKWQEIKKYIS